MADNKNHAGHSDEIPYLELGDELPYDEPGLSDRSTPPKESAQPLSSSPNPHGRPDLATSIRSINRPTRPDRWQRLSTQLSTIPRHYLILLALSSLIILALLPQFLATLAMIGLRVLLAMRVLALPLAAIFISLWLIRMFYRRRE